MKFCMNVYLDNPYKPIEYQGHRSKVKVTWFFVFFVCMILLEPVGLDSRNVDRHGPRAVLSLDQGLTILLLFRMLLCLP